MQSVEINFIVKDSLAALAQYEAIFDIKRIEVTDLPVGENEVIFSLYGTRFHMLDENPDFQLFAPSIPQSVWFNVIVPNITEIHAKALAEHCTEIQVVNELTDYGVSNSMFVDSFGYQWMLHQINREVSFEERMKLWEEKDEH